MKANFNFGPEILDNQSAFQHPFYQRFELRKAPNPIQLTSEIAKNYDFPTFYGDVTCAIGIFFCDYDAAKAMMPHPSFVPVKATKGRAIVIFSCYEYKKVLGVAPYNEIAMTIPVMINPGFNPPILPLVMKAFKNFGYYVFSMPVTSEENRLRGVNIWGLPKVTQDIDITFNNDTCTTIAKDENGIPYFELSVPMSGKQQHFDETGYLYSILKGEILKSQTNFMNDFAVNKNMSLLWKQDIPATKPTLVLGNSPQADVLKKLKLSQTPFQTRFTKGMTCCFDLAVDKWKV
jgi:hypothetical protein